MDGKYLTLADCIAENKKPEETAAEETKEAETTEEKKEKAEKEPEKTTLFYVTDEIQQSQYINMFREEEKDAYDPEAQY